MGWPWAMWFVQQLHGQVVCRVVEPDRVLRGSRPPPDLRDGHPACSPYCDNLGVLGIEVGEVLSVRERVTEEFMKLGFKMHEETVAEGNATRLGGRFHGDANRITPTAKHRPTRGCIILCKRQTTMGMSLLGNYICPE